MVQCQTPEPSTIMPQIRDGPYPDRNLPRKRPESRPVPHPDLNLPRYRPESRMVPSLQTEPSTLETDIVDGSMPRTGPSTLAAENPGRSIDSATQIPHTVATAGRQAGPFPEPSAVLPVCSRRRCFIPAAVPPLALAEN